MEQINMLIVNGKIYTMESSPIECGYIQVKGNKIASLGSMSELPEDLHHENIIDVDGAWILPGLIESHAHIGITEEKYGVIADDSNEETTPITPTLRAIDAVNPMDPAFHDAIEAGITSVMTGPGSANVVGGQFVFMKTHGRCIDEMIVKNPAAINRSFQRSTTFP
jgi:imidazolonepropionase-like amidohydrolase